MFKILDGREAFYQWDTDQRLIVADRSITQVHFCNRTDDCALICECYEQNGNWVADVPNILLQENWRIRVYAYDGCATRHDTRYDVIARSKPDTYVYTETEVLNYETIKKQMDAINNDIEGVVRDYLEENPLDVDLTGYATEEFVNEALAAMEIPDNAVLLEQYITNEELGAEVQNIWENGLQKPVFYNNKPVIGYKAEGSSTARKLTLYVLADNHTITQHIAQFASDSKNMTFSGTVTTTLATEDFVTEKIGAIDIPETDLTNYYNKTETDAAINEAIGAIEHPTTDLSEYAKKSEIPSLDGYATETYVDEKIAAIEIPEGTGGTTESVEEVHVGTEEPTDENIKLWVDPSDDAGFATKTYVDEAISTAIAAIIDGEEVAY